MVPGKVDVEFVGPQAGAVASGQGAQAIATSGYAAAAPADIVLVPGGRGTRRLVADGRFLSWLRGWAGSASLVTSVCTGSALLAAAGLLDGYDATSNKRAFDWVRTHGEDVRWIRRARWVEDRPRASRRGWTWPSLCSDASSATPSPARRRPEPSSTCTGTRPGIPSRRPRIPRRRAAPAIARRSRQTAPGSPHGLRRERVRLHTPGFDRPRRGA